MSFGYTIYHYYSYEVGGLGTFPALPYLTSPYTKLTIYNNIQIKYYVSF